MHTVERVVRIGALALLVATAVGVWWQRSAGATRAHEIRQDIEVKDATIGQLEMVRWAVGRFEEGRLDPPAVEIEFHRDRAGCDPYLGRASHGTVDVCTTLVNMMARQILLHEMSHIWLDQNVGVDVRARFLELRELPSWNASHDPWRLRGYEQGAEIIAWVLGERTLMPLIPDNEPYQIAAAYEVLTGIALPPAA